jgi:hypothetical protein
MMLKRIAAVAACALLLVSSASAQLIGSGHVMGNGTASPAAPTDNTLLQIMSQSGSGISFAGNTSKLATVNGTIANGHCRSTDANGNDIDAGGACTVGGGGGTVNSASANQFGFYASTGNAISGAPTGTVAPVNVRLLGAVCDGSTNDTTALNAAFAGGQKWFYIPGICNVTTLNAVPAGIRISGCGNASCSIATTSATGNVLPLTNGFDTVDNLGFVTTVTRTNGAYVEINGGDNTLHNILMSSADNGIILDSNVVTLAMANVTIGVTNASGVGVIFNSCTNCEFSQVSVGPSTATHHFAGFVMNNSGDLHCYDCNLFQAQNDLYIDPSSGQSVASIKFLGGYLDTATANSLNIVPSGNGNVNKVAFTNTWFDSNAASTANWNILPGGTSTVDTIQCVNCEFYAQVTTTAFGVVASQPAGTTVRNIQIIGGGFGGQTEAIELNGVTSAFLSDITFGFGLEPVPSVCLAFSGSINILSFHDINNNVCATPLSSSATVAHLNQHNNNF